MNFDDGVEERESITPTEEVQIEEPIKEEVLEAVKEEKKPETAPIKEIDHEEENKKHREHNFSLAKRISNIEKYLDVNPIPKTKMRFPRLGIILSLLISLCALVIALIGLS